MREGVFEKKRKYTSNFGSVVCRFISLDANVARDEHKRYIRKGVKDEKDTLDHGIWRKAVQEGEKSTGRVEKYERRTELRKRRIV